MADLNDEDGVLDAYPAPYHALVWLLETATAGNHGYLGNPVRHFQHLASRISGPRSEIRAWRAWLCFHLAENGLPAARFPRDGHKIASEGLAIPSLTCVLHQISKNGWRRECAGFAAGGKIWCPDSDSMPKLRYEIGR